MPRDYVTNTTYTTSPESLQKNSLSEDKNAYETSLKIGSLNLGGLMTKVPFNEFHTKMSDYDVVGFVETKLQKGDVKPVDTTTLAEHTMYHKFRKCKSNRISGGISIAVKNGLTKYFSIVDTENEDILWCKFNPYNGQNNCMLIGVVYISPVNSPYSNKDSFVHVERDIADKRERYPNSNICLLGDFNAHTKNVPDYFTQSLFEEDEHFPDTECISTDRLTKYNIPLTRETCDDLALNTWGRNLLDICRNSQLIIVNGRKGINSVKPTTCHNTIVDYVLCNVDLFNSITEVIIDDFDRLFSDVHCFITFNLEIRHEMNTIPNETLAQPTDLFHTRSEIRQWDEDKKIDFIACVTDRLTMTFPYMVRQLDNEQVDPKTRINDAVSSLEDLFRDTCVSTFGTKKSFNRNTKAKHNKPWFDKECKLKRKSYNKAKRRNNIHKTTETKNKLKLESKKYKQQMNASIRKYQANMTKSIRKLKDKNPKAYWKLISGTKKKPTSNTDIKEFFNFFKTLNEPDISCTATQDNNEPNNELDLTELNQQITQEEIMQAIKRLKNGKSSGIDNTLNEHIKHTAEMLLPLYHKLFNLIFDNGIIPDSWKIGIIHPVYKNKGDKKKPENYRPITLLSCLGKVFTSVINERLNSYIESNDLLNENQLGFRKDYSTADGILALYMIIEIMKNAKQTLYCTFVDLRRAFPSVNRLYLWQKLTLLLNGKIFNIIKATYQNVTSAVKSNGEISSMFNCSSGLREGSHLAPILFALFINDLEEHLLSNGSKGIEIDMLKILTLLYADDTVLFSNSHEAMQDTLNHYEHYCNKWQLQINEDKTKVMIFGRKKKNTGFKINDKNIEIVNEFKYLGVIFSKNRYFTKHRKYSCDKATQLYYHLLRKIKPLNLPIECQIDLFDQMILPVLTYGCEITGINNIEQLEKIRLQYYKKILKLRQSTPGYMVLGETGKFSLESTIKKRMIKFWTTLVTGKTTKLSAVLYRIVLEQYKTRDLPNSWLCTIKTILNETGFPYVWDRQIVSNPKLFEKLLAQTIEDQCSQKLRSQTEDSHKRKQYMHIKEATPWDKKPDYLTKLDYRTAQPILRFRTQNHYLPVESGRHHNVDYLERTCPFCPGLLGDEYHYICECKQFDDERKAFLKKYYSTNPSMSKFLELLNTANKKELTNLSQLILAIMKEFTK